MREHILIVDDDPSVRKLLVSVLGQEGYRVSVAASAESALVFLQTGSIDLLITDKNLPGMSGFILLVRAREMIPELGAVMITGFPEPLLASNARLQGYLAKPFDDLKQIRLTVRRALDMTRMVASFKERQDASPTALSPPGATRPKV